ncbi:MAG TPA: IS1595 family transposase [Terracidiphilus sp.]|nr:IS1595 family transposase [Terracidiphilus sp.]
MTKNKSIMLEAMRNAAVDEAKAVMFLENQRWGNEPHCPNCGAADVYRMMSGEQRNKDYRWRCKGCKRMYSVRTKSVLEETRLPLRVWVYAIWKAASSKKGISALQLSREMEITHKSALFVLRRLRHGLQEESETKLTGTVEVDEVYIGGRPRYRRTGITGRGTEKTPVLGMVQRGGDVRFHMMERLTMDRIASALAVNADQTCRVITDEYGIYKTPGKYFAGGHETVAHSHEEFVRPGTDVHTNTIEGVFSLLQRGVMGTFHSVSRKHLPNYLNEFQFRWNTRKLDDGERVSRVVKALDGKRLEYRESVDNPPYLNSDGHNG